MLALATFKALEAKSATEVTEELNEVNLLVGEE